MASTIVLDDATQTMTNKTFTAPLLQGALDGWIAANETWTYASATTFTVSGDVTGKYAFGDRVKLTQTTAKYFYVIGASYSAPNTTITVTGGSSYTLANAAITLPYYSKQLSPQAFPDYFNFTVAVTGFSANPASMVGLFCIHSTQVTVHVYMPNTGTSNSTAFTVTMPVFSANQVAHFLTAMGQCTDNGAYYGALFGDLPPNSATCTLSRNYGNLGWTAANGKSASFTITYKA